MHSNLPAWIVTDKIRKYFTIEKEIKQEDPLSSILFNSVLEEIRKSLE